MDNTETVKTEKSLAKAKKICALLKLGLWVLFALFCVYWLISLSSVVSSIIDQEQWSARGSNILQLILCLGFGCTVAMLFVVFMRFFSDVARGQSPFTMMQVSRLRIMSALLLVYFVVDALITNNSVLLQANDFNSGYMTTNSNNIIVTVNFSPLIAAAVVFAFSYVFKYGVLLQEFSDETL